MNIKAIANKIGLDYENALEDFCGDVSELSSRLQKFASSDVVNELKKSFENGDHANIKKIAHSVRNSSEKIWLTNIAKIAGRVETADDDKIKNATAVLIEKLEEIDSTINKKDEE